MSNFQCEHCGAMCCDSPAGYTTGCEHYPPDIKQVPKTKPLVWHDCPYNDGWQTAEMPLCHCYVMYREGEYKAKKAYHAHVHQYTEWFDTEAEAKAWCQAEYERRVRECLE